MRAAAVKDIPQLLEIQAASPEAASWSAKDYRKMLEQGASWRCLVAEREGRVLGLLVYQCSGTGAGEILNLAVDPAHRRQGVGRMLIAHLTREHCAEAFLEVRESNKSALRFYEALGFVVVGRRKSYYNNPPEDAVAMRWAS